MTDDQTALIDIEAIVRNRLGAKAKYVPGFALSWLRGFIHQDYINGYLRQGRQGVDFCRGTLDYLGVTVSVEGQEHLPTDDQRCVFVSNHPLGAIDGVTLGSVLGARYEGRVKYLVNDLLMNLKGLAPLCVPINKIGKQARNLPAAVDSAFRSDNHIIMFPAGLCSRKQKGVIHDLPWCKTFVKMSIEHHRNVVPVHFLGQNSNRFYSVATWCKRLHLPNLAMALLPDEMYRSRGRHYTVRFGRPISWQTFDKQRTPAEWANYVEEVAYAL